MKRFWIGKSFGYHTEMIAANVLCTNVVAINTLYHSTYFQTDMRLSLLNNKLKRRELYMYRDRVNEVTIESSRYWTATLSVYVVASQQT